MADAVRCASAHCTRRSVALALKCAARARAHKRRVGTGRRAVAPAYDLRPRQVRALDRDDARAPTVAAAEGQRHARRRRCDGARCGGAEPVARANRLLQRGRVRRRARAGGGQRRHVAAGREGVGPAERVRRATPVAKGRPTELGQVEREAACRNDTWV